MIKVDLVNLLSLLLVEWPDVHLLLLHVELCSMLAPCTLYYIFGVKNFIFLHACILNLLLGLYLRTKMEITTVRKKI